MGVALFEPFDGGKILGLEKPVGEISLKVEGVRRSLLKNFWVVRPSSAHWECAVERDFKRRAFEEAPVIGSQLKLVVKDFLSVCEIARLRPQKAFSGAQCFFVKPLIVKDPDDAIVELLIVAAPLLSFFEGNGGALNFKNELFFFPGDVSNAADFWEGAFDSAPGKLS